MAHQPAQPPYPDGPHENVFLKQPHPNPIYEKFFQNTFSPSEFDGAERGAALRSTSILTGGAPPGGRDRQTAHPLRGSAATSISRDLSAGCPIDARPWHAAGASLRYPTCAAMENNHLFQPAISRDFVLSTPPYGAQTMRSAWFHSDFTSIIRPPTILASFNATLSRNVWSCVGLPLSALI